LKDKVRLSAETPGIEAAAVKPQRFAASRELKQEALANPAVAQIQA